MFFGPNDLFPSRNLGVLDEVTCSILYNASFSFLSKNYGLIIIYLYIIVQKLFWFAFLCFVKTSPTEILKKSFKRMFFTKMILTYKKIN